MAGRHSYETLSLNESFRYPSKTAATVPILHELVAPHIESFNALFQDGSDGREGLIALGVKDIGSRVIFDGDPQPGAPKDRGWGNKLESEPLTISARRI